MSADPSQHRPESSLEESAEELYEMAPCGYLTTTLDGRIVKVNRTLTEWLGYGREELVQGKRFADLLTAGGRIFYETHFSVLLRIKPSVDEIALDLLCKDGRALPALINARQKRNAAGEPVVNRFTVFNASERRTYERELLAARDLFRTTLASIGDGVIATDFEGRVTFMNPVAEELSGWRDDAARGRRIEEVLVLVREDNAETLENPVTQALRTGTVTGLANRTVLVSKDGRRVPVDDSASPIRDSNGNITGGVLVFRDISVRRKAEELEHERQERHREAARLESLGVMAGGIAHDFNNLLTGILGNACLLAESASERDSGLVGEILRAGERAAALAKQMLAYSGKHWLEIESLDLNAHLRNHLTLMQSAAPAKVRIELELSPDSYVVEADAVQLQQVIMNLLMNASEAMPEGEGRITIRTEVIAQRPERFSAQMQSAVPAGTYAVLEVRDNGTGIPAETLKNIFDPFFTTRFTGRGLGLSEALGIVKGHHGDIEVASEPGSGSAFRVFLPAVYRGAKEPSDAEPAVAVAVENQTVLVVDDEEMIRKLASAALKSRRIRVLLAKNGAEAVSMVEREPAIAAVILDLMMPVMNGDEALPLINAIRPDLPVIISSGFSEAEILRRLGSVGITGVLSKPYTIAAILSLVTKVLTKQ